MKIHHLGYIVKDIKRAKEKFFTLGFNAHELSGGGITHDKDRQVEICFIKKDGYTIELISPTSQDSPFYPMLKKHENCAYHICYESFDVKADVIRLKSAGFHMIDPFKVAPAIENKPVAFFFSPTAGIIEIIDSAPTN